MVDSMVAVMSTKEGSISSHQEEEYKSQHVTGRAVLRLVSRTLR